MKRALSMLLALVLLLSCFSGMVVSAEEMDETEVVVAPEATEETEPATEETEEPATEPEATEPAEEPAAEPEATEPEAPAEEAEPELSEAPMETVEWFSGKKSNSDEPATYGATYEHEVPTAFMNYLNQQFAACKTEFDVSSYNIPYAKWEYLKSIIWYETPEWFHVKTLGCSYYTGGKIATIRAGYRTHSDTASEYKTCLNKMVTNAEVLLRGIKGNNNLSDVEKALLLHDRLALFVEYDLGNVNSAGVDHKIFAAYSALGEGLSVCQGYALAYMYLLDQVDIESDLCQSDALWHAWNIVYINNKPYHVDVTWDDPTAGNYGVGYYDAFGRVTHVNFLRSTAGIRETGHTAYDYITTPTDTYYDEDCWWMDTNTSIELIGNALYHLDYNNGRVYKLDDSGWATVYQSGNYSNSKMAKVGTKLLMSQQKNVLLIDPATGSATTVFSPSYAQYSGAYIYGMKYENGKITCQISYNGSRYCQSMSYVDESSKVQITKQPQDVMVANGKTATTSVEATGDGLTYVWYFKNPADKAYSKSSVTTNTYSTAMAAAKNGRTVYCVITDLYGNSVTSNVATLRMGNVATITQQPSNAAAPVGQVATVTVKATGDGLSYTWFFKGAAEESFQQTTYTAASYSVIMDNSMVGSQVYCVIADQYGNSVTSDVATFYVGNTLKITTQPKNVTVGIGQTVKIPLKATGDGLTYTWYFKDTDKSTYSVSSVTTNTYTTTMKANAAGRKVYCIVTDQYGCQVKSAVVTIYKGNLAKITTQPTNAVNKNGKTVKVTIKATGDGLTYTWYYANKGSNTYTKANTGTSYSVKMSSSVNGRKVYCVVKDKYGTSVKSNVVTLYKGTPAKFTKQPVNTKAPNGMKATLTVKASGSGLKYAWYYKDPGTTTFKKSSTTGKTYSAEMNSWRSGRQVYCQITDKYGVPTKSNTVTLSLAPTLKITQQPYSQFVSSGSTAKVTVKASGDGVTYTWYYAKSGSSSFKKASGKSSTYSVKMSSSVSGRRVYCLVKDKYGASVKSNVVTLTDPYKAVTGTWKGDYQRTSSGYWYDISHITMKITTDKKVTIKVPYSGTGYNSGTFTYKLSFVAKEESVLTFKLKNTKSSETLYMYYFIGTNQLMLSVGSTSQYYYK